MIKTWPATIWLSTMMIFVSSFAVATPCTAQGNRIQNLSPAPQIVQPVQVPLAHKLAPSPTSVRIKDITTIEGHRGNRVTGIGLVTGLKGTGGKSELTKNLARNMLRNFDILANDIPTGNISVVAVTAEIPPYVRPGETINATVSIFDDGTGLYGGELHSTTLKGLDGQVYAIASGGLVLGGFSAGGEGASVSKNHDMTGKVQARIEVGINNGPAFPGSSFSLLLVNKDYSTAFRIAAEINRHYPNHARANDQGKVNVYFPQKTARFEIGFCCNG